MNELVGVVGKLRAKSGKEAELVAMMAELSGLAKVHEPGMVQHAIFRSRTEPGTLIVVEVFRDQAAFEAHTKANYFPDLLPRLSALIEGQPGGAVEVLEVISTS